MNRLATLSGLLATAALACAAQAPAATRTTDLDSASSAMGLTAHGCLQQLTTSVSEGENCMYDGGMTVYEFPAGSGLFPANPFGEATGPFSQAQYYDSTITPAAFAANFLPSPGDGKIQQVINGTVTIEDNGNGFGADDLISFDITMTSPGGGNIIRNIGSDVADQYTSMTQVLSPTVASSATPNGSGGFDYVIGSEGFPVLLTFTDATADGGACVGQSFGDMECDAGFDVNGRTDPLRWTPWAPTDQSPFTGQFPVPHVGPPQSPGLGSLEGNFGARTTGTVVNLTCADDGVTAPTGSPPGSTFCTAGKTSFNPIVNGPNQAPAGGNGAEDVGWDQLVLKVSTDAAGNVLSAEGFDVQEYMIFGPPGFCGSDPGAGNLCNTWLAGHFTLTGDVLAAGVADDDTASGRANEVINVDVLANDTLADNITALTITTPSDGTAVVVGTLPGPQAGLSIDYTSSIGFSDDATFDYTVTDASGSPAMATVTVTVSNQVPVAMNDAETTAVGSQVVIDVLANDTLGDGPSSTVDVTVDPTDGVINTTVPVTCPPGNCSIAYTPSAIGTDDDTFTYSLTDDNGDVDTAIVTVTRSAALGANDDMESTEIATPIVVDVLLNDINKTNTPLTVDVTMQPTKGTITTALPVMCTTLTPPDDCSLTYLPNAGPGDVGDDTFVYEVTDSDIPPATASATVTIFINDVPVAFDDPMTAALTAISTPLDVLANDQGLNDSPITITVVGNPANGTAVPDMGNPQLVTYTSDAGFVGQDTFTYDLQDSNGDTSNTATVTVTVDDQPGANDDGTAGAPEFDVPTGTTQSLDVLANDTGLSDTPLTVTLVDPIASLGAPTVTGSPGDAGAIRIDYAAGPTPGTDSFGYQIVDSSGDVSSATAYVAVTSTNVPFAVDDSDAIFSDEESVVDVLANDSGLADTPLSVTITSDPANGVIDRVVGCTEQGQRCEVVYVPDESFDGVDFYTYMVTDGNDDSSNVARVNVTVRVNPTVVDPVRPATLELPSGSAIGPWSIGLLLLPWLWRRRK